jgi:hypothetical protein
MKLHGKRIISAAWTLIWAAGLFNGISPLFAAAPVRDSLPQITVRIYGFPGLPPGSLALAEAETARLLRGLEIHWIECTSTQACSRPEAPDDLTVRVVEKALPGATPHAMGMATWSGIQGGAFVFYDRALALRTPSRLLQHILGRVIAHEILHLLSPQEPHSDLGLMRGHWTADDVSFKGTPFLWVKESAVS